MKTNFEQVGRDAAALVMPSPEPRWVHRRVQSLRYLESCWTEIRLSVDFDVPAGLEWVPITVLPKWPPLYRIDYVDHEGHPLPILTSEQNGAADYGLMAAIAKATDERWLQNDGFCRALSSLTRGPETTLDEEFDQLLTFVSATSDPADQRVSRFLDLAASLIDSTLLWYPVARAAGAERTIAKLAYHLPDENTDAPWVRVFRSLSWWHPPEWMALPHIGGEANFHLEIEAPVQLLIREIGAPLFWWLQPPVHQTEDVADGSSAAAEAHLRPEQYVAAAGHLAHAYVSGSRPGTADIEVSLAAPRNGFVGASFAASLLIALFVTAMFASRTSAADPNNRDASVALLAVVPAIIGYLVVRPSDPAIVRRHLMGVQILVSLAAAVPVTMGVLLVKYGGVADCLTTSWQWAVIVSWLVAAMLAISVVGAGSRQPAAEIDH